MVLSYDSLYLLHQLLQFVRDLPPLCLMMLNYLQHGLKHFNLLDCNLYHSF